MRKAKPFRVLTREIATKVKPAAKSLSPSSTTTFSNVSPWLLCIVADWEWAGEPKQLEADWEWVGESEQLEAATENVCPLVRVDPEHLQPTAVHSAFLACHHSN